MKYLLFLMLVILISSCNQNSTSSDNPSQLDLVKDSLSNDLSKMHAEGAINGFGVAIVSKDEVLYENGFGYADLSKKDNYTKHTIQNIASISKTLIGIALLKCQEMGKLSLDDPISKHLPFNVVNPNFPNQEITIRHLATHTSSILDGDVYDKQSYVLKSLIDTTAKEKYVVPEEFNPPAAKTSMKVFLEKVLDAKGDWYSKDNYLKEPPGQKFEYTNIGATLAAHIIEMATGEGYNDFTRKHILEPLGMTSTGWSFEEIEFSKHTKLYANKDTLIPFYSLITYPDGGLLTSINDLSKYIQELIRAYAGEGKLLSQESYKELFKAQLVAENFEERDADNPYNDEYNMGIFMGLSASGNVGHTGGDPGVSTFLFFDPKTNIGRMLMINTELINREGQQQFFGIWNKLEEYQLKLKE